jgi:putative PEP-CTERM system TPR-repeat lipoprotein
MLRSALGAIAVLAAVLAGCSGGDPQALLASGKDYLAKNDKNAAAIQFKNALQQNPKLAEARFLLGTTLLDKDAATAEKELRKALEYGYPAEQVKPQLARALVLLGQYKQLVDEFAGTQVSSAENAELQTALGKAYLALGDIRAAERAFAAALAAHPNYAPAQIGAAQVATIARDFPKALTILESALARTPNYAEAWLLKADIYAAQGRHDPAFEAYRKAVEAQPDLVPAHVAIVSFLIRDNKLDEAAKRLEAMKQVAPAHPQTMYLQALLAYNKKDLLAARQAVQQQLSVMPDYLPTLALAGIVEYGLKSYALSEGYLSKVLQVAPEHWPSRQTLIATYLRTGEIGKALDALEPALGKIDNNAGMLGIAGETYMMKGDHAQAAVYFAKAAALDPSDTRNRTALAVNLIAKGDTERGLRELEQTAAKDTGSRADLALIAVHMQRREYDKALSAIAAFEKKQPDSPAPHSFRGDVFLTLKNVPAARRSFERAVELNSTYFPAVAKLALLDVADNKPEAARQRFEAFLAKEPKHREALLALAGLRATERGANVSSEVTALLNRAVAAGPSEPSPRVALILYYLRTKEPKKAISTAQDALAAMPNQPALLDAAGLAYQAAGDVNQAMAVYVKLAAVLPKSALPHIRMAQLHLATRDKEAAAADLQRALSLQPDHIGAQRGAIALDMESGRYRDAIAIAQQIQKQRPKETIGYALEGDVYASNKQFGEAVAAYRRGLKEAGSIALATRLYDLLQLSGDTAGAEQFAATWLKDPTKSSPFRLHLAQTAVSKKDYRTAAEHYRKVLGQYPNDALLLSNLAAVSGEIKDPKAIDYAEQAYKLAPKQPLVMGTLGMLLIEKGDTARGLELLSKAAAIAPQIPEIRLDLAKGQIKAGQKDAARKELDELSKLGEKFSRHAEVKRLKQEL